MYVHVDVQCTFTAAYQLSEPQRTNPRSPQGTHQAKDFHSEARTDLVFWRTCKIGLFGSTQESAIITDNGRKGVFPSHIMQGPVSAYFTIFSWSYLKVHATKLENADQLYERHLGNPESIFKVRMCGCGIR